MPKKKTHEDFVEQIKIINPNIEILGNYEGNKIKIECKCLKCGNLWNPTPSDLIQKRSCPKCAIELRKKKRRKSHEDFLYELNQKNPNIEVLGKYINAKTKIKCKCKIDNYIWESTPDTLLSKSSDSCGCPICRLRKFKNQKTKKDRKTFIKEMKEINPNIKILTNYFNAKVKVKCECLKCGYIWWARPNGLVSHKTGCPYCNNSKLEEKTSNVLKKNNINFIVQYIFKDCKYKAPLRFDFYLPNNNVAIECDGEQHKKVIDYFGGEENLKKQKIRDEIKNNYCKENGIKLIRIPYWEENNIEKILLNELGNN